MDYALPSKRLKWWQIIIPLLLIFLILFKFVGFFNVKMNTEISINTFNWINTIGIFIGVLAYTVNWIRDINLNRKLKINLYKELESNFYAINRNLVTISEFEKNPMQDKEFYQLTNNTFWALVNTNKLTILPDNSIIPLTSFYNGDQTIRGILSNVNETTLALINKGFIYTDIEILITHKEKIVKTFKSMIGNTKQFLDICENGELFDKWQENFNTQ